MLSHPMELGIVSLYVPVEVYVIPLWVYGAQAFMTVLCVKGTEETENVRAVEFPHDPTAITEMVPPLVPAVAEMLFVELVPDQPAGSAHV